VAANLQTKPTRWTNLQAVHVKFYQDLKYQTTLKSAIFDRVIQKIKRWTWGQCTVAHFTAISKKQQKLLAAVTGIAGFIYMYLMTVIWYAQPTESRQ